MLTAAQMLAMTDSELGISASGGYGAAKRNEFYASLRAHLLVAARQQGEAESSFKGREPPPGHLGRSD